MIEGGYDPREIAIVLGISRETVYKHKILIGAVSKGYREIINKISRRRKTREFWKIVEKFLRPVELILESQNNMKARAKLASGDWS